MNDKTPWWVKWLQRSLTVIGALVVLNAILHGPTSFSIKISFEDWNEEFQPIYLVESKWWGCTSEEYLMRYSENAGVPNWEYFKDGRLHSLDSATATDVDIDYWVWPVLE